MNRERGAVERATSKPGRASMAVPGAPLSRPARPNECKEGGLSVVRVNTPGGHASLVLADGSQSLPRTGVRVSPGPPHSAVPGTPPVRLGVTAGETALDDGRRSGCGVMASVGIEPEGKTRGTSAQTRARQQVAQPCRPLSNATNPGLPLLVPSCVGWTCNLARACEAMAELTRGAVIGHSMSCVPSPDWPERETVLEAVSKGSNCCSATTVTQAGGVECAPPAISHLVLGQAGRPGAGRAARDREGLPAPVGEAT